jgi:hypothetical protein
MKKYLFAIGFVSLLVMGCSMPGSGSSPAASAGPLKVVSVAPAEGSTGVAVEKPITATFSASVNPATLQSNFTMAGVSGMVTYDDSTKTATFTPDTRLAADTAYSVSISTNVTDSTSKALEAEKSWSFTTTSTPAANVVVTIDPATIASMVPTGTYPSAQPPSVVPGKGGQGASFADVNQFLLISDSPDNRLTGPGGAIECWLYPRTNVDWAGILHKGVSPDWSDEAWSLQYWYAGNVTLALDNASGAVLWATDSIPIPTNAWTHIVATWDASNVMIYHDGAIATTTPFPAGFLPIRDSSGAVIIGKQLPETAQYNFDGVISGIQVYDRTLTAQEIADHYNATK